MVIVCILVVGMILWMAAGKSEAKAKRSYELDNLPFIDDRLGFLNRSYRVQFTTMMMDTCCRSPRSAEK